MTGLALFITGFASALVLAGGFPVAAILIGWYTRNRIAAVATGALLFPLLMVVGMIATGQGVQSEEWLRDAVLWHAGLAVTGGLAGLFASYGNRRDLQISIVFAIVWICVFLSGIR
ncbi:MAG: hypothetical protein M0R30_00520 [Methanoregula sp.]|jgi:ABC-type transport system involved in multi-copper enzyme maturation permease subunit|uniref:hypothetical protein n=1 Tax=Methanoregula sp. TaxID=2052170 RepID=UPI0025EF391C|nr:hypothetical protein [Methanoregula sp.]MCK9630102.1 hypothetical protein [Methanoregula sp.]